jgi:N-methylhydantoinase A
MQVSVDIGGTFTDCLVHDDAGHTRAYKVPTTPHDPSVGLLASLERAAQADGLASRDFMARIELLVHGTTLGTNTLLTGSGATVGLITTAGFRDVLELRRGVRNLGRSMFDQFHSPYRPLVPRARRLGVPERVRYTGEMITPLGERETERAARSLLESGCDAIAIGFLHAHVNPDHERRAREIVEATAPDAYVVCSHDVLRTRGEFERFSTTVVSAYIGPTVSSYLRRLEDALRERGFEGGLLIMQGSGLVQTAAESSARAVQLLVSGPAAAPSAALEIAGQRSHANTIEVDMGGTSFDICVIRDGKIPTTSEAWVGEERVAIKMIEVATIGAGGGSIASIDSLGLLRVGPESAGADPGPAAYGRAELPTVTDADLVLGYVPADYFLGGVVSVDVGRSRDALARVAEPLGLDVDGAALAVFTTVNSTMADAIVEACTKKGHDVRDFVLVAGGGGGGVHAASVAELLGLPEVIFPVEGALLSALGMLTMDLGQELARSEAWTGGETIGAARLAESFGEMEELQLASFARAGVDVSKARFARSIEMRYEGQYHAVEVPLADGEIDERTLPALLTGFHERYESLYGYSMPWQAVEFLQLHVRGSVPSPVPFATAPSGSTVGGEPDHARRGHRGCFTAEGRVDVPAYDRGKLQPGIAFDGPALVDSETTTVLVPESFTATVDERLNLVLRRRGSSARESELSGVRSAVR